MIEYMWLYPIYFSLIILLLVISLLKVEAWPFSAYPMFSSEFKNKVPTVLYFEMQLSSGEQFRWRPMRPLYRKRIDNDLKIAFRSNEGSTSKSNHLGKVIAHYYQLFCAENHKLKNIVSIHVVQEEFSATRLKTKRTLLESFKVKEINAITIS